MRENIYRFSNFAVNFLFRESAQSAGCTYLAADRLACGPSLINSLHLQKWRRGE
jgi:hypothetical protein